MAELWERMGGWQKNEVSRDITWRPRVSQLEYLYDGSFELPFINLQHVVLTDRAEAIPYFRSRASAGPGLGDI